MRTLVASSLLISILCACSNKEQPFVAEVSPTKKNSKAAEINMQLGLGYLKQGEVQRAKKKLVYALEQAPKSPDAAGAMAYFFETTGNEEQAGHYYLRALQLAPNKGAQLNNYGAFLCRHGEYARANHFFERAVQDLNYVNSAGALENAGLCSLAIPNVAKAKAYLHKALEQDPKRDKALYELAKLAIKESQYKDALALVKKFELSFPLQPNFAWLGYQAAAKLGKVKEAQAYAWILKTKFPESLEYKYLAGSEKYDSRRQPVS